jgi:SAM-dependent methyltransferase
MDTNPNKLAQIFKSAATPGILEKPFREKVEAYLIKLAEELGLEMAPHKEVTLGTSGRADTIYNRFIVEWERPGSLKRSNHATTNTHTIAQVKDYGDSLFWRTREKPGRLVGCCTDGNYFIFVTKPERLWIASDPVLVDVQSCQKFLDYFQSLQSGIALLPDYLSEDFSSENVRTQRAVRALYKALLDHAEAPSLDAIFNQWAQFFGAVTEYEQWRVKLANEAELRKMLKAFGIPADKPDLNRFFYATHTFFAILTKLLAYIIVGRYTDLPTPPLSEWKGLSNQELADHFKELERGGPFHKAGIRNFLEGDFFSWYTKFFTPELADCLRPIVTRLAEYDPATLDLAPAPTQDLLKKLYHRLVSPHIRKALGEYYTPDWLAQRLLNMLDGGNFRGDPEKRLLDPACGSGTFLLMAINAIRRNSVSQSMDEGKLLRKICHNVVGIDLNPLAVIAARTNYLLALGPLLKHRGKEPLDVPVYLADSIMTPSRGGDNLFEQERVRVLLSIGKVELPRRLATQDGVATLTNLLDKHLDKEPPTAPTEFICRVKSELVECGADWGQDAEVIEALYRQLHKLHAAGRNGLWARILKNAFAPVFLAPFDYVAGNPPWINWQNLPEGYRSETKALWFEHGLFVHSGMDTILGKGKKDISMLMTYVAADSYLKDGGRFGFVITQSVFKTSGAGQGFRRFETRQKKPLEVVFVDDFTEMQLFEGATNRTAAFIMRKGRATKYPVQYAYWRKKEAGRKGGFDYDSTLEEVTEKTKRLQFIAEPVNEEDNTSAWLSGRPLAVKAVRKLLGKSDYEAHAGIYSGGANAVYWFDILHDNGDGTVTARNITEGAKRKTDSIQVRLEKDLLYPLLRGRDVCRWQAKPGGHILFVQDAKKRRGIDEEGFKRDFPYAYQWLKSQEKLLVQRAAYKRYFNRDRDAFYSMFNVGDYTLAKWKTVWMALANGSVCAVAGPVDIGLGVTKCQLPEHNSTFIECDSADEAYFVCGCFNSTLISYLISSVVSMFYSNLVLDFVPIPRFESANVVHRAIAAEAKRLSSGALDAPEPVNEKLDTLCARLWDLNSKDLASVQDAHRELNASLKAEKAEIHEQEEGQE